MAYLIDAETDDRTLHATTHGMLSRSDIGFFRERVSRNVKYAANYVNDYLKEAKDLIDNFDFDVLRDKVEAVRDRFGKRWDEDRIMRLTSLADLQQAKPKMQRYLMANPRVRKLFYGNKVNGYNGAFYSDEPGLYGNEHSDYRNVMQGGYVGTDDEDRFVTYLDVLHDDSDDVLTFNERLVIREAWALMDAELDAGGQDPTSPSKTTL